MDISYAIAALYFKSPFGLSSGVRKSTPVFYVKLATDHIGFGEAAMPPYVGEDHTTAHAFLQKAAVFLKKIKQVNDTTIHAVNKHLSNLEKGNFAIKAAIEMALFDLYGKSTGMPLHKILNVPINPMLKSTYTLSIGKTEELASKILLAEKFSIIKVKLSDSNVEEVIKEIRKHTNKPIVADINQGWELLEKAIDYSHFMKENNVLFIEQPFRKDKISLHRKFVSDSALPVIADESIQGLDDLIKYYDGFNGVNIKLMKCGGVLNALSMIQFAKNKNMITMMGCMSESSCGISAASQIVNLCDWADLDGPLLIKNDFFSGTIIENGNIELNDSAGIGVAENSKEILHFKLL